jgi:putative toxin-antitoxin system antitoxin component (TIGR02293 family)
MSATRDLKKVAIAHPESTQTIRRAKISGQGVSTPIDIGLSERIQLIRGGIPARQFDSTAKLVGLSKKGLAEKLGLSSRTLSTRKESLSPEESEKTLRTHEIFNEAKEVFGSAEEARAWISAPAYGLNNQKPIDLLDTDAGAQQVKGLLGAIKYGNVW